MQKYIRYVIYFCILLDFVWGSMEDKIGTLDTFNEEGSIACQCGNSRGIAKKTLDVNIAEKAFKAIAIQHENVSAIIESFPEFKDFINDCTWCGVEYSKCLGDERSTEEFFCIRKSAGFNATEIKEGKYGINGSRPVIKSSSEAFPKIFDIPIGGGHKGRQRRVRHAEACSFPTSLETSNLHCRVFPSSVKCRQRCAFGYTLENGIEQTMQCRLNENKWVPTGFKECHPFVDCTLTLVSGGYSSCKTASLTSGPECVVACLPYEDKDAVAKSNYICNIDGKWDPQLPFCVIPGSGLVLENAPSKKMHDAP